MSESVDILIQAEDMATPVIDKAAKAVDGLDTNIKKIKESGQQAKKSTDFFRVIANSLGGTEIGSYVGQIGEAAEKTSQFAEVQKLGGAGAFAFKAGLAGLVGTIAIGIGNALGNVIFQTEKWTKRLEEAKIASDKLNSSLFELKEFNFGRDKEVISLIQDPDEQLKATQQLLLKIENEINKKQGSINALRKQADAPGSIWSEEWADLSKATTAEIEKQIKDGETYIDVLKKQTLELRRSTDETALGIKARKAEIELENEAKKLREAANAKQKADQDAILQGSENYVKSLREQLEVMKATDDQKAGVTAGQKAVGPDVAVAEGLIKEIELRKFADDAWSKVEADQRRADAEKEQRAKTLEQLKQSELDKLEQERILLTQGAVAAKAFALEKQGMGKEDAMSIALQEAELQLKKNQQDASREKMREKPQQIEAAPALIAAESRLLTRGNVVDSNATTAKNTSRMIEQNDELRASMDLLRIELEQIKANAKVEVEVLAG